MDEEKINTSWNKKFCCILSLGLGLSGLLIFFVIMGVRGVFSKGTSNDNRNSPSATTSPPNALIHYRYIYGCNGTSENFGDLVVCHATYPKIDLNPSYPLTIIKMPWLHLNIIDRYVGAFIGFVRVSGCFNHNNTSNENNVGGNFDIPSYDGVCGVREQPVGLKPIIPNHTIYITPYSAEVSMIHDLVVLKIPDHLFQPLCPTLCDLENGCAAREVIKFLQDNETLCSGSTNEW